MRLGPLNDSKTIEVVAGWLAQKENYQWLDFGEGRRILSPPLLKILAQKDTHVLRVFTSDQRDVPIGVIGLNNLDQYFKSGTLWIVLGEKSYVRQGYATRACLKFLTLAFRQLGLHSVNTWVVDGNPSLRVAERLKFRFVGRQRECHRSGDRFLDRILFDLLASEHKEI